jgi:hypothetical protein
MTIDWLMFLPALLLLLTPGDVFNRNKKVRYRDVSRDWDGYWSRALVHGLHSIDLVRAALGTWLLLESLHPAANAAGFQKYEVLLTQGGIRILAVLVQTVFCREEDAVNAPFTFVTGLLLGGVAPLVALFAVALALPVALGSRVAVAYFPVLALAHMGVGFWFLGKGAIVNLGFGAAAAMVPFLWSIMFRRDLVVPYRLTRAARDEVPSRLR